MSDIQFKTLFNRLNSKKYINFSLILIILAICVAGFLYFDQRDAISLSIQRLGLWGNIIAILLMAFLYMTPIPSEGLLVLCFKIYGIYWGILLSWMGINLSSVLTFFIARTYGQELVQRMVSPEHFGTVNNWVKGKGTLGLFIARLLPVPAFAINCIAGVIPSVRFWPYFWTAAVSIIPYFVVTSLVFMGIYKGTWQWLIFGAAAVAVFWGGTYALRRRQLP